MTVTSPAKQSLSKRFPHIAKQWHPEKNGSLNPTSVAPFSHKKVWWLCDKGHEWKAQIGSRSQGRGCPYCSGKKVGSDNNLAVVNPELARQWHPTKNGELKPDGVTAGSGKAIWWLCDKGHEWKAQIGSRSQGTGCPFCAGKKVGSDNNLAVVNPELARQWHPTKNGELKPDGVTAGSGKAIWWLCGKGHEWKARIVNRNQGIGCPYCAGRLATADNNLAVINPELARQWHPTKNKKLRPRDVTPFSGRKVWWQCNRGHEWTALISNRSQGKGCPFCVGKKVGSDNNLLIVNPELARQWHPKKNGDLTPAQVVPGTHKSVWWLCGKGHEWKAQIYSRSEGRGCPYCAGRKLRH